MKVEEHVPFSTLTTFKVGGSVRYVLTVEDVSECSRAVTFAKEHSLPLIPLGGGSNMLGVDGVLDAVFVRVLSSGVVTSGDVLTIDAGSSWDQVVAHSVAVGLWGLENLSAIPGTVGGAVVQNIGAYGAVLSDVVESVDAYDTHTGTLVSFSKDACAFGYRTSVFKQNEDQYIVVQATLRLSYELGHTLTYKDLQERFGDTAPSLQEIRTAVMQIRERKFPPLSEFGTAGSFFLNPVMTDAEASRVQAAYPAMPLFPLPEGGVKVPLAWFLDHVMELRGAREGSVEAWRDHVLALVAHPGATAEEVRKFAKKISDRALSELHIHIHPEVRFL